MTNEEVRDRLDIIITKHEIDDENVTITNEKDYDAIRVAIKALEQQTCEDAVSRQVVLDYIDEMPSELTADGRRMIRRRTLEEYISDSLSSVNPQPKTGHWIFDEILDKHYYCSECKSMGVDYWDYCPNCGAKMVEPQESEVSE